MKTDEVLMWLRPVESWVAANVAVEADPDEKWHQAQIAWDMVKECFWIPLLETIRFGNRETSR